jgi:hypothetical protein
MIMNELSKNVDGYRLSAFLFKDRNGLFNCGPIWDFNLGYGNADYYNGWIPAGFQYQAYLDVDSWQVPFWWRKLMKDQAYVAKLKTRWTTLRKKELADQRITFVIDSLTNLLSESKDRNYLRWQGVIGFYIWPNYYIGQSYNEEVTWMKNWIAQRLAFLDGQWIDEATGAGNLIVPQRFSVYPNPFSNRLTVQLPSGISGKLLVELYNSTGSLVRSNEVAVTGGDLQLNFTGTDKLVPGLYLYKLVQNNRLLASGKVVEAN